MIKNSYIDTHCHLFEPDFYSTDSDDVIEKIENAGVKFVLLVNTSEHSLEHLLSFEKKYSHLCRSMIGIHPDDVTDDFYSQIKFLEDNLLRHNFIGIGEIGLDYYRETLNVDAPKKFLITELELAKENDLPVSIHVREAFDDALKILRQSQNGNLSGVIHCFTGTLEQAKRCIDLGFALGIGGIVTFKNSHLPELLKNIDIKNIVLETDSPFLTPVPFRGKRNDSSYLPFIVDKLSEIYDLPHDIVAAITTHNAEKIFSL